MARHFLQLGPPQPPAGGATRASFTDLSTRPLIQPKPPAQLRRPAPLLGATLPSAPPLSSAPSPAAAGSPAGATSLLGISTVPKPPRLRTRITPVSPLDLQFPPTALPEPPPPLAAVTGGACLDASNVQRYGVQGDGKADVSSALRSADAALPTLWFPPGSYRLDRNLTLTKTVVMGERATGQVGAAWAIAGLAMHELVSLAACRGQQLVILRWGAGLTGSLARLYRSTRPSKSCLSSAAGTNTRFVLGSGVTLRLAKQPYRAPAWGDAMFTGPGAQPPPTTRMLACSALPPRSAAAPGGLLVCKTRVACMLGRRGVAT